MVVSTRERDTPLALVLPSSYEPIANDLTDDPCQDGKMICVGKSLYSSTYLCFSVSGVLSCFVCVCVCVCQGIHETPSPWVTKMF